MYFHISTELQSITDTQHEHVILPHHIHHGDEEITTRTLHDDNLNIIDDQAICTAPSSRVSKPRRWSLALPPSNSLKYIKPEKVETEFDYVVSHVIELLSCCDPKLLSKCCEGIMASTRHNIKCFSANFMKILQQLRTSPACLRVLSVYWSWSNHSILLTLAQFSKLALDMLLEFDGRLNHFLPLSHYPIPSFDPSMIPSDISQYTILAMRCDDKLQKSLQLVFDMESLLVEICGITKQCLHLLAVQFNPTRLYWMIPNNIAAIIDSNVQENCTYLYERSVRDLFLYPDTLYQIHDDFKEVSDDHKCEKSYSMTKKAHNVDYFIPTLSYTFLHAPSLL